ncbi:MAG: XRE family transcriptional regulator [Planctomycetota bacterium]
MRTRVVDAGTLSAGARTNEDVVTAMEHIGARIRAARRTRRLTGHQLAALVGCTRGYLSQVEAGRVPSNELLERIEGVLGFESGELVGAAHLEALPESVRTELRELKAGRRKAELLARLVSEQGGLDRAYRSGVLDRLVRDLAGDDEPEGTGAAHPSASAIEPMALPLQVPLINSVTAGYPAEFTDLGYPARVADEYVSVPDVQDPDAFAARVVGDSMEPQYREGDIVVFSPSQGTPPGTDCFVRFERDAETTFKRVYFEVSGEGHQMIRLQPINPSYPPRTVEREAVAGMYAAVYVVRPVGLV